MTLSHIAAALPNERMMTKYIGTRLRPSRDEIARLAYHFYEMHGRRHGHDVDDWLSAERELAHRYGWPRRNGRDIVTDSNESAGSHVVTTQCVHRS